MMGSTRRGENTIPQTRSKDRPDAIDIDRPSLQVAFNSSSNECSNCCLAYFYAARMPNRNGIR
jgi:hypothetical protein